MSRTSDRSFATHVQGAADLVHDLAKPYRPELQYMRGPGPKWHAKHDPMPSAFHAVPALLRVRVKR